MSPRPAADALLRVALAALVALVALAGGCGGDPASTDAPPGADAPINVPDFGDPLVAAGTVELVQSGFQFTEGPQWREAEGDLVFSDIQGNTIYRYTPGGPPPAVLRNPSNNSNGLATDGAGVIIAAEHGSRSVTRTGAPQPIASTFEGKRLNSPNDVIVADDGTIYFTDPPYGIPAGQQRELDFMGVFRVATNGTLTAIHRGPLTARPNGIGLAPDGRTLYVADTDDGNLYRFPIAADGTIGARAMFAATSGGPDGLAIDIAGNVFVATSAGIEAFSPAGVRWGAITVPMQPANCAFGDADHRMLYITARTTVYRVRLAHPGLPRR
jgi:gluconolactonase